MRRLTKQYLAIEIVKVSKHSSTHFCTKVGGPKMDQLTADLHLGEAKTP